MHIPETETDLKRYIGTFTGETKGPLLICIAGMHGNEPAGISALDLIFKMLEIEPVANPSFFFRGRVIGLRGNVRAIQAGRRFFEKDLNRMWTPENIAQIKTTPIALLQVEELEMKELLETIETEIGRYQPEKVVLLDLHTTTAYGGIFSIVTGDPESVRIAVELHAPVIKGMLKGIQGTLLHYFHRDNFQREIVSIAFESGQHQEPLSVNRAIAAVINCMRTIGCVDAEDVQNRHDEILIEYARDLPKVAELITAHRIQPGDNFRMQPGYKNFQPVKKGEILAYDKNGPIRAPDDGRILMPLYQTQGNDGFFLIRDMDYEAL